MPIRNPTRAEDRAAPSIPRLHDQEDRDASGEDSKSPALYSPALLPRLAAACAGAVLIEMVLLWRLLAVGSAAPWRAVMVAFLVLTPFWAAAACAMAIAGGQLRNDLAAKRPIRAAAWPLLTLAVCFVYLQFWTFWIRTKGLPLGKDGLSTVLESLPAAAVGQTSTMLLLLLGVFALWPFAIGAQSKTSLWNRREGKSALAPALLALGCLASLLTAAFDFDADAGTPSWKRPNPLVSLAAGLAQTRLFRLDHTHLGARTVELMRVQQASSASDSIPIFLNRSELTPIRSNDWAPPPPTKANRPPIIFFKIDSLRRDVIGLKIDGVEVMPELTRLAAGGVRFTRAYSPSTSTERSDPAILSSLYPLRSGSYQQYTDKDPWPKTLIYDALHGAGYATGIFSAGDLSWCDMEKFLRTPGLDILFDGKQGVVPPYMGDNALKLIDDEQTVNRAFEWMARPVQEKRPFFVFLDLQSPHFPYMIAPTADHPFQPSKLNFFTGFYQFPTEKIPIVRNAYLNGLREADRQLGRFVRRLREAGLFDDAIIAVYGDHGEAFGENGQVTHAQDPFEPTVHVGCVLHSPARVKPGLEDYPMQLIDLAPTIFARMGWPKHPNFQGVDVLSQNSRPPLSERFVFCRNSTRLSQADAVILAGRWKYFDKPAALRHALYDLVEDSSETEDASARHPEIAARLQGALSKWRRQQLAYYTQPVYYTKYYPPPSPR